MLPTITGFEKPSDKGLPPEPPRWIEVDSLPAIGSPKPKSRFIPLPFLNLNLLPILE
jgi:hypothetical protein